jgi:hypothetical protein
MSESPIGHGRYTRPEISDYGTLSELTAGCLGAGAPDAGYPGDIDAFPDMSPAFGDPAFCDR